MRNYNYQEKREDTYHANSLQWVCCQLGAREHYAVPRALQRAGLLNELITDLWCRPRPGLSLVGKHLGDRFHPELQNARVKSANRSFLLFELTSRVSKLQGWNRIQERNKWFQNYTLAQLSRHVNNGSKELSLFTYSYVATSVLGFARQHAWRTFLGQIDPGPTEERIVARLYEEAGQAELWEPAPAQYWDEWHYECELADQIVVNSQWSRRALISEGIADSKISVIPLAFEPSAEAILFRRKYPEAFTQQRPLRVLFLGQINLRKGVGPLFEAIQLLKGQPIEFWFVGPVQVVVPKAVQENSSVKWFGTVTRLAVRDYYRAADLFIFPTFSDGFGLTQLEAQSWKLPIVTTPFCGDVVHDGLNGVVLREVRGEKIAATLLDLLRRPDRLQSMSDQCPITDQFSLRSLAASLLNA